MLIKEGTILVLSTGEWSDTNVRPPARVLRAFDQQAVSELFKAQWEPRWDGDGPDPGCFCTWLETCGFIETMDHHSWHVGSYGEFTPQIQEDDAK